MKAILIVLLGAMLSAMSVSSFAHGGGKDAWGCHTERRTGDYHCH